MTNGGFVAIRSNRSPRTGSKKEPSRTSTRSATSLSAALNRAMPSARWLTSVATTRPLCAARCSACTPQPVPRSRLCSTGARTVSWASEVEAGLMPSTWSAPTRCGCAVQPGGQVADHPEGRCRRRRRAARRGGRPPRRPTGPGRPRPPAGRPGPGSAASAAAAVTVVWSRKSRVSVASGPRSLAVRRSAGVVSLRSSAASATGPSSSPTASTVKSAATSASRSRAGRSGEVSRTRSTLRAPRE